MINLAIKTILPGVSASENIRQKGQFGASLGIDPLMPDADSGVRPGGNIRPTQMLKFSESTIDAVPLWMVTNPKDALLYVYTSNGKVYSVASNYTLTALNSGTALTTASGNGAEYYDNYLYLAKNADICRYGPLNGSPSFTQNYWTSTLSLTAPTNNTYPSINSVAIPNHFMWRHTDGALYICDVLSSNKGALHKIKTTKTTVEGDTNNGSDHDALDFDYGWWPVVGCSFGNYLLVAFIEGTSTTVHQRPARLILWDTVSASFDDVTIDKSFKEPLITALQPLDDGSVLIFSGKAGKGCRVDRFYSLNAVQHVGYFPDLYPPLPGAVDFYAGRSAFGTGCATPSSAGCVMAYGSPNPEIPTGMHNILLANSSGTTPQVTALRYFLQGDADLQPVIGWKSSNAYGLDRLTTTANTSLVVKAYFDNASSNTTIATIDNTTLRFASHKQFDLQSECLRGKNDFYLQFEWSNGSVFRTEKEVIGKSFNISRIRFSLATALAAKADSATAFVGTIELPVFISIDEETD